MTLDIKLFLHENRLHKNGVFRTSTLGRRLYYFFVRPNKGTEQHTNKYHVALLENGLLVCTYTGFPNKYLGSEFGVCIGRGILHHEELF